MEAVSQAGPLRSFTERRPRVMLEWDPAQNKVMAPRLQVGISCSQTSADTTMTSGSHSQSRLADGFDIPEELLELSDLNDILSVETWENCMTHSERDILSMYLPEGVDPESTVVALLTGGNFHFGNPLQTWGKSVCTETMHPDAILHRELKSKEQRKAYSKRLRSYHGKIPWALYYLLFFASTLPSMVQNVRSMKEMWEECENPEDFLPQIQRFGASGWRAHVSHIKNVFLPYKKAVENADLRKRHRNGVGEGVDLARETSTRPKAKKQKVNKLLEEGSKRLKIMPVDFVMEKMKIKPSGGPNKVKIKPTGETPDFPISLKGGKLGQPEEGTKTLKIKSPEGAKRLEIKPLEEGRKKGQGKPSWEDTRRPKRKPAESGINALQMKPGDDAAKRLEMKMSEEGLKGLKVKPSEGVTRRLKIKPSGDGRKRLDIKPAEEGPKRLQTIELDDKKDLAKRSTEKRLNFKSSEEGAKRLESEHAEVGTKKSQIKLSEAGRKNHYNRSPKEERDPPSRPNAKRSKVKCSEEERTLRPKIKFSERESKSLKIKPSREGPKLLKMKASEERSKALQIKGPGGEKRLNFKRLEEGAQRPKITPPEETSLLSRLKEKRSQVRPQEQGTKRLKIKQTKEGQEERDIGHSDFEGEWFKKHVQVTVGPLSGHSLSKAIQSVKVTTKMFKDVKRRSESGEEIHLDSLVPIEGPSSNIKASKKATDPSSNGEKIIGSFWQNVLIKDLPAVHVRFMQKKEQLHKLAISLASSCKNLWEIEVSNDEVTEEDPSPSGDYTSPCPGFVSRGAEYASPSLGEPSFSGREPSPSGGEASPSESEPSASGSEASASGGEPLPSGRETMRTVDESSPSGVEAMPSGEDALQSGDEGSPSEAELEENWGMNSLLLLHI